MPAISARKLRALKEMGGRVTTVREFLGLTLGEDSLVEMHVDLAIKVQKERKKAGMTQAALAKVVGSTQARIAKLENGDPQASLESMVNALGALGFRVTAKVTPEKKRPK